MARQRKNREGLQPESYLVALVSCRLHVKRGTWNGMERGMEHGMERGTDVKCPNKPNKRVN